VKDRGSDDDATTGDAPTPPKLRQGPGPFAWISLALLLLAAGALGYAGVVGAYGSALVSALALIALSPPTLILMAVWIEVQVDNRRAMRRYEAAVGRSTRNQ
jgi:hypothetical protein